MRKLFVFLCWAVFFIWLPNASADGDGLSTPPGVSSAEIKGKVVLLTLRLHADNIQVYPTWQVHNALDAFEIREGNYC